MTNKTKSKNNFDHSDVKLFVLVNKTAAKCEIGSNCFYFKHIMHIPYERLLKSSASTLLVSIIEDS